jgi:hydroxymethylbilane synthase
VAERVRIGTRGSPLALCQAELVAAGLRRAWPGLAVELVAIRTSGDRFAQAHLAEVGGKGLFVKEIEEALLAGRVEAAVHSLKDLPSGTPPGLTLAAFPTREEPRDVLVSGRAAAVADLPAAARVGTSSPRRRVQLLARRRDLAVEPIRGNVETRLRKLDEGAYDAIVLAAAGLRRLGIARADAALLDPDEMLPAVGQGTLAVEILEADGETAKLVAALDDAPTRAATEAERAFLAAMGGTCTTPLAAHAWFEGGRLRLSAFVATPDGGRVLQDGSTLDGGTPAHLGQLVAERMLARGAAEIIAAGRAA